ncbi:MAG: hypothetical protein G3W58_02020 [Pantoea ananatis]|nr:hypothetical protein [Pantoea ananatis]
MPEFNLQDLLTLSKYDPDIEGFLHRKFANTKEQFVEQLYKDIDDAIHIIENNKHMYQSDLWGEDELTAVLITFLKGRNYNAEHDTQHGGHIDILIQHQFGKFEWIGEAKIWSGPAYIWGGWIQLNERYGSGTVRDDHGGMIIYVKIKNSSAKLNDWKKHLNDNVEGAQCQDDEENPLRFSSITNHPATEQPYYVRHMAVSLFHHTGAANQNSD